MSECASHRIETHLTLHGDELIGECDQFVYSEKKKEPNKIKQIKSENYKQIKWFVSLPVPHHHPLLLHVTYTHTYDYDYNYVSAKPYAGII